MKESPIPFTGDMVRAVLSGQKTQTRRVLKDPLDKTGGQYCVEHADDDPNMLVHIHSPKCEGYCDYVCSYSCPYGQPGDRLWVKETHARHPQFAEVAYRADGEEFEDADGFTWHPKWTPSIFMPRALCRIILEITDIRVERVQDISEEDVQAEGFSDRPASKNKFRIAWDLLYWKRGLGWDVNPWVWVVTFKRAEEVCQKN